MWLEGMDSGMFAEVHVERYVKDIPLARALQTDVLVAYAMTWVKPPSTASSNASEAPDSHQG